MTYNLTIWPYDIAQISWDFYDILYLIYLDHGARAFAGLSLDSSAKFRCAVGVSLGVLLAGQVRYGMGWGLWSGRHLDMSENGVYSQL